MFNFFCKKITNHTIPNVQCHGLNLNNQLQICQLLFIKILKTNSEGEGASKIIYISILKYHTNIDIFEHYCFHVGHPARNQHSIFEYIPELLRIYRRLRIIMAE